MTTRHLNTIAIEGFRSIKNLDPFKLNKTNILVGANGAGKSNFIEAFKLNTAIANGNLQGYIKSYGHPDGFFFNGIATTQQIHFSLDFKPNSYYCELHGGADGSMQVSDTVYFQGAKHPKPFEKAVSREVAESSLPYASEQGSSIEKYVLDRIKSWKNYHFHNTELLAPLRRAWEVKDNFELHDDGRNLAPFIMRLRDEHPEYYQPLLDVIRFSVPSFGDFILKPTSYGNGQVMVDLMWRNKYSNFVMQHYHLSDGSLRLIALITCLLQPNPPSTIIIDEPELGQHPTAINLIAEAVNHEMQKSQVIIATQSPLLVDAFTPDDIITVNYKEGESVFARLDKDKLNHWLEDYSLGELWRKNIVKASP